MISEGSCDTEDGSNDAEKSALRHRNKFRRAEETPLQNIQNLTNPKLLSGSVYIISSRNV